MMLRSADRVVARAETLLAAIAAVLLFAIMAIVACDVFMRYVFNRPFAWSYDLISLYLMAALFYLPLSHAFAIDAHIGVDILQTRMNVPLRRLCHVVIGLVTCALFATIAAVCAARAWDDFTTEAVAAGAIPWPSWAADALVPLGAGLLSVRGLVHAVAHFVALCGGPETIRLPPLAGSAERVGFE